MREQLLWILRYFNEWVAYFFWSVSKHFFVVRLLLFMTLVWLIKQLNADGVPIYVNLWLLFLNWFSIDLYCCGAIYTGLSAEIWWVGFRLIMQLVEFFDYQNCVMERQVKETGRFSIFWRVKEHFFFVSRKFIVIVTDQNINRRVFLVACVQFPFLVLVMVTRMNQERFPFFEQANLFCPEGLFFDAVHKTLGLCHLLTGKKRVNNLRGCFLFAVSIIRFLVGTRVVVAMGAFV